MLMLGNIHHAVIGGDEEPPTPGLARQTLQRRVQLPTVAAICRYRHWRWPPRRSLPSTHGGRVRLESRPGAGDAGIAARQHPRIRRNVTSQAGTTVIPSGMVSTRRFSWWRSSTLAAAARRADQRTVPTDAVVSATEPAPLPDFAHHKSAMAGVPVPYRYPAR